MDEATAGARAAAKRIMQDEEDPDSDMLIYGRRHSPSRSLLLSSAMLRGEEGDEEGEEQEEPAKPGMPRKLLLLDGRFSLCQLT